MNPSRSRRSGFTLLEILVVLGIAAFVASLALGGFSSFQGSQRRSTCQSNLVQIYRACRLYANDNEYYPPLLTNTTDGRVGGLALLWGRNDALPANPNNAIIRPPLDSSVSYLKSATPLHCPADVDYQATSSPNPTKEDATLGTLVDPKYLSYQKADPEDTSDLTRMPYNDVRTKITSIFPINSDYSRQLRHLRMPMGSPIDEVVNIPTPSSTVVTWCRYHRGLSKKPDNVLFYDGSVRRMEVTQPAGCLPNRPPTTGWLRLSECSTSSNNEGAALAQP